MFEGITSINDFKYIKDFKSKVRKKGDDIVANETLYILIPARYENAELLQMTNTVTMFATYIIVDEKLNKTDVITPTLIDTDPAEISNIKLDDVDYIIFKYYKDSAIVKGTNIPMSAEFAYSLFKEFLMKGNIPTFIDHDGMFKLFSNIGEFTGSNISDNVVSIEILISLAYRDSKDSSKYYRQIIKKPGDKTPYITVPINNIERAIRDPLAILTGAYFNRSTTKLLNIEDPNRTEVSVIEETLMK